MSTEEYSSSFEIPEEYSSSIQKRIESEESTTPSEGKEKEIKQGTLNTFS